MFDRKLDLQQLVKTLNELGSRFVKLFLDRTRWTRDCAHPSHVLLDFVIAPNFRTGLSCQLGLNGPG